MAGVGEGLRAATASALKLGLGGSSYGRFLLFVDEALSNALRHGKAERVVLKLRRGPDKLSVALQDDGRPFNPLSPPPLAAGGENGYGLKLMKGLFKNIRYRRLGGDNLLEVEIDL